MNILFFKIEYCTIFTIFIIFTLKKSFLYFILYNPHFIRFMGFYEIYFYPKVLLVNDKFYSIIDFTDFTDFIVFIDFIGFIDFYRFYRFYRFSGLKWMVVK